MIDRNYILVKKTGWLLGKNLECVCVQRCVLLPHETRPFSFLYILDQGDWAFPFIVFYITGVVI